MKTTLTGLAATISLALTSLAAASAQSPASSDVRPLAAPVASPAGQALPAQSIVTRTCTVCHGAEMFADRKLDRQGWAEVVEKMAGQGAEATPEEFTMIVDYLTTASAQHL